MASIILQSENEQQESPGWDLKCKANIVVGRFRETLTVFFLIASNTLGFIFEMKELIIGCVPCFRFWGLTDFAI